MKNIINLTQTNAATVRQSVKIDVHGGTADFVTFDGLADGREHVAIGFGQLDQKHPFVRIHSECLTGDVFGSARCDCGEQLHEALRTMGEIGGVVLYLRQEGRGIGLNAKIDAYALQDHGHDTFEANRLLGFPEEARDFRVAAQMLKALGLNDVRLLTNNPDKADQLKALGVRVYECVPTGVYVTEQNERYLKAKAARGHHIDFGLPIRKLP